MINYMDHESYEIYLLFIIILYNLPLYYLLLTWPMAKRLKLFGITYLVGKLKFKQTYFRVPGRLSETQITIQMTCLVLVVPNGISL